MSTDIHVEVLRCLLGRIHWPIAGPWSLAELRVDEADFGKIQDTFRSLTRATVRDAFVGLAGPITISNQVIGGQAVLGLFLLLVFAETARRRATEGSLWASIRNALTTNSPVADLLFDANGQPIAPVKALLERAARRFGLRHAFDLPLDEGPGHQWYTTIFLQFGFSSRGFVKNATYWMRNMNLPKAVRLLLSSEAVAAGQQPLGSDSFVDYWRLLRLVARRIVAPDEARRRLASIPWVPTGRIEDVLDTIKRADWSDLNEAAALDNPMEGLALDSFVGRHWWRYCDGQLEVRAELSGLSTLDLSHPFYDIVIDGQRIARLVRSGDAIQLIGTSQSIADALAFVIRLPRPLRPSVVATLVDPTGVSRAEQALVLWDSAAPISIIVPGDDSSRALDISDALPKAGHLMAIADAACRLDPQPKECLPLDDARYFAGLIDGDAREKLRVLLGDLVIWVAGSRPSPIARAPDVRLIQARGDTVREGDAFDVAISTQASLTPTCVWYEGTEYRPNRQTPDTVYFRLSYMTARYPGDVELVILFRVTSGQVIMKRTTKQLPVTGFFRMRNGRLHVSEPNKPITRNTLLRGGYFFLPPEKDDGEIVCRQDWFVMEGTRPLARFPARGQPRYPALGLGAPLTVRTGPLNARRDIALAAAVTDFGELRPTHRLVFDADGALTLQVQDTLLDQLDEYSCVLWDTSGLVSSGEIVEQAPGRDGFVAVRILPNLDCNDLLAVGLSYRGIRIAAAWTESWSKYLRPLVTKSARNAAALLRWLHLPVLSPKPLTAIRHELLASHSPALLLAWSTAHEWTTDDGQIWLALPDAGNVQGGLLDTAWYMALREVTSAWTPSATEATCLIDTVIAAIPDEERQPTPLVAATVQLIRIHPRLAIRTLQVYLKNTLDQRDTGRVVKPLALRLAGVSTERELRFVIEELEEQCAQSLSALLSQPIDTAYVRGLGRDVRNLDYWHGCDSRGEKQPFDIEVLCNLAHGRRYLALEALGSV